MGEVLVVCQEVAVKVNGRTVPASTVMFVTVETEMARNTCEMN